MLHPHAIHEESHDYGVRKGKWHVAAAVLSLYIHDFRRAVPFEFFPLYILEIEKHER